MPNNYARREIMKHNYSPFILVALFIFIITAVGYSYAQTTAIDPPELIKLRSQYRNSITSATTPIRSSYLNNLKLLYDQKMRLGQLDAALAVKEEIEQVSAYEFIPGDGLKIISATYGQGKNQRDVTQKVVDMIKDGSLTVTPVNSIFGDPAPGMRKELIIKYTMKGRTRTLKVQESTTATIQ
jgi:hypothetical protein